MPVTGSSMPARTQSGRGPRLRSQRYTIRINSLLRACENRSRQSRNPLCPMARRCSSDMRASRSRPARISLAFGSNLQRGLGGKAFRKVARARYHDREAMRPSLEDDHRKPLTDRRQNKGVRGGEGGPFFGAE